MTYIGRFAPSPTGPLHAGSLVAALASYLDAMVHDGQWLLRIDDADLSRVQPYAASTIAEQLKHYGLQWHGSITHTQDFIALHRQALSRLQQQGQTYACQCSRAQLATSPVNPEGERVYNAMCAAKAVPAELTRAVRLRVSALAEHYIHFEDRLQGVQSQDVAHTVGDFVLWRPEQVNGFNGGLYNYQLTIVVDDAAQGVNHIVRGADLLGNTARQCLLYDALAYPRPSYAHVPIRLLPNGLKLSKQHGAPALPYLSSGNPLPRLDETLVFLGLTASNATSMQSFWRHAAAAWESKLRGQSANSESLQTLLAES